MKKLLLLFLSFQIWQIGFSQVYTVDMTGDVGEIFYLNWDNLVDSSDIDLDLTNVGSSRVWNFQNLDTDAYDTMKFVAPNTQEQVDFPDANLVIESSVGRVVFERNLSTGFILLGTTYDFLGTPVGLNFTPGQITTPVTASLGTMDSTVSYINETIYLGLDSTFLSCQIDVDSIKLKRQSIYRLHFDAAGELRLPNDTFPNTLRALSAEYTTDSIFIYSSSGFVGPTCSSLNMNVPPGWSLAPNSLVVLSGLAGSSVKGDTIYVASWNVPHAIAPVCIVTYEFTAGYTDTIYSAIRYASDQNVGIGIEEVQLISLNLYPNPTSDYLKLDTDENLDGAKFHVFNAQGQSVSISEVNSNVVNVANLQNGMYFYQLTRGNKLMHRGKLVIRN